MVFRRKEEKQKIKIAVSGVRQGVGATFFTIMIANYYGSVCGKKVAVIDLNKDNDYFFISRLFFGEEKRQYHIKRVAYFAGADIDIVSDVLSDYECIVFDCGDNYEKYRTEISLCDKKFLIGSLAAWKLIKTNMEFERQCVKGMNWKFLLEPSQKENLHLLSHKVKEKVYFIPQAISPFKLNGSQMGELEKIIGG